MNATKNYLSLKLSTLTAEVEIVKTLLATLEAGEKSASSEHFEEDHATPEVVAPKKKATPKTKAKPVEAPVVEAPVVEATPEVDDLLADAPVVKKVTVEQVRDAVKAFALKHGRDKALALILKFNANSIAEIKEKDYEAVTTLAAKYL